MTLRVWNGRLALLAAGLLAAFAFTSGSTALRAQQTQTQTLSSQAQATESSSTLSLKQAVTLAQQNSADLKLARMQYNVARSEVNVDRAAFHPNLYTGAGYAYTYGFPSLGNGNAPAVFQLDYNQSVFDPETRAQQHAAEERAKSLLLEVERTQSDVIARTATAYLELAEVRHSLQLLGTEQTSAEKVIDITNQRIAANQELPIEATRAQLALAEVHERMVRLQGRDEVLSGQIRDLTGLPDTAPLEISDQDQTSFAADIAQQSDNEIVSLALQNDKTIAEAEHDRVAKADLLRGAKLSYFPTVALVGQYSVLSKYNNYDQYYAHFQRNNLNAGIQITIPIFAARTSATVAFAKSELAASEATLVTKRQQVRSGVEQQQQNLREIEASRDVANWALKLAQQTLELQQSKLQQGQATLGDVEQAQLDESEKFVEFLDANFAQQKAQISLLQATGQLAKVFP
ncbi:MAG TPA: TolC family protein [Candidatus Acidoferrales bacterium]|nr:TolC family protein [Candidatus Acidoferrales bacterium]